MTRPGRSASVSCFKALSERYEIRPEDPHPRAFGLPIRRPESIATTACWRPKGRFPKRAAIGAGVRVDHGVVQLVGTDRVVYPQHLGQFRRKVFRVDERQLWRAPRPETVTSGGPGSRLRSGPVRTAAGSDGVSITVAPVLVGAVQLRVRSLLPTDFPPG